MTQPQARPVPLYAKWVPVLGLSVLYLAALPSLYRTLGTTSAALGIFPAALAGWYFGVWGGCAAGLGLSAAGSLILYRVTGNLLLGALWPGIALILWSGLMTGYLRLVQEDRARTERELQRRLREARALADIGRALSERERVSLDHVLQLIVDSARELIAGT